MRAPADLDPIDLAILRALQADARTSNKQIAAAVGLSPSASLARMRLLERHGVIRGYHAELDPVAVGVGLQAMIAVRLTRGSSEVVDAFRTHASELPEVVALYQVSEPGRFWLHVAVRDADHLRGLEMEAFASRSEVAGIETSLIFEHVRTRGLPSYE